MPGRTRKKQWFIIKAVFKTTEESIIDIKEFYLWAVKDLSNFGVHKTTKYYRLNTHRLFKNIVDSFLSITEIFNKRKFFFMKACFRKLAKKRFSNICCNNPGTP